MKTDEALQHRLGKWRVEPLSEAQQERIIRHALAQPQQMPWLARLQICMEAAFGQWRVGLAYKLAALTLCAFAGTFTGFHQPADALDTASLVWGDVDWVEDI